MSHKPSDDIRALLDFAKTQETTTAAREAEDKARAAIEIMEGKLLEVEQAISSGNLTKYVDPQRERMLVKGEIANLTHQREEAIALIASKTG